MVSTIGIKIANGEFYPIVEENLKVKKRLVLTTAHDKQRSVQIDLYKSYTRTMADALYVGSLVVENIRPRPKGEPSIELIITSTKGGDITADAVDLDTTSKGEHHTLNVSLKTLDDDNRDYELPDFELEHDAPPPTGLYEKASGMRESKEKRGFPWLIVICAVLVLTAVLLAAWFFLLRNKGSVGSAAPRPRPAIEQAQTTSPPASAQQPAPAAPPQAAQTPPPTPPSSGPMPPPPPPVIQAPARPPAPAAPASRQRPVPPVRSYKVPSVIPREGAAYRVRWGDTLWDIAEAFYRNPWLYPRIARFNNIRNPDLIISGSTIRVPPRN